jgi:hypothetical protein
MSPCSAALARRSVCVALEARDAPNRGRTPWPWLVTTDRPTGREMPVTCLCHSSSRATGDGEGAPLTDCVTTVFHTGRYKRFTLLFAFFVLSFALDSIQTDRRRRRVSLSLRACRVPSLVASLLKDDDTALQNNKNKNREKETEP